MSGHRDFVKRIMPNRFVNWWRNRRVRMLESAGGATRVTPRLVAHVGWAKTAPARSYVRRGVVKVTPKPLVTRRRRKRAYKRYMKALSYELLERETQLDYIEGRVSARRDGFYERIVRDVLERTEMILQELDRRIEGVSARGNERSSALEEQLLALRDQLNNLRQLSEPDLADVDARARAEAPEVATAEDADAVHPEGTAIEDKDAGSEGDPSGNGHVPAQAPAATAAE